MLGSPENTIGMLKERLKPDAEPGRQRIDRLVADLKSEDYDTREEAQKALQALGEQAEPALRRALADKPDLEQRRRAERLLRRLERPLTADELRDRRAIFALEQMGTPEARALLTTLARGGEWGRKTLAASGALERLKRQKR
jgi:HEAT repeat protein